MNHLFVVVSLFLPAGSSTSQVSWPLERAAQFAGFALSSKLMCKDIHAECAAWASSGECQANPDYLNINCRASCQLCDTGMTQRDAQEALDIYLYGRRASALALRAKNAEPFIEGAALIDLGAALQISDDIHDSFSVSFGSREAKAQLRAILKSGAEDLRKAVTVKEADPAADQTQEDGSESSLPPLALQMPRLGLGTGELLGDVCTRSVRAALRAGYRHIDTAENYGNEADIGRALAEAIADGELTRADLFVATKLSFRSSYGDLAHVRAVLEGQLHRLGLAYVDLYMLHGPIDDHILERRTWTALRELRNEGLIRHLGVSNFGAEQIERLTEGDLPWPRVMQNKFSVYHQGVQQGQGEDVLAFVALHGIVLVAYSTLNSWPAHSMEPLRDPIVAAIAARSGWTPAQVLLRHAVQLGLAVIPRSSSAAHIAQNANIFKFSLRHADMDALGSLQRLIASPWHTPPPPSVFMTAPDAFAAATLDAAAQATHRRFCADAHSIDSAAVYCSGTSGLFPSADNAAGSNEAKDEEEIVKIFNPSDTLSYALYWDDGAEGVKNGVYPPHKKGTLRTTVGHRFFYTLWPPTEEDALNIRNFLFAGIHAGAFVILPGMAQFEFGFGHPIFMYVENNHDSANDATYELFWDDGREGVSNGIFPPGTFSDLKTWPGHRFWYTSSLPGENGGSFTIPTGEIHCTYMFGDIKPNQQHTQL